MTITPRPKHTAPAAQFRMWDVGPDQKLGVCYDPRHHPAYPQNPKQAFAEVGSVSFLLCVCGDRWTAEHAHILKRTLHVYTHIPRTFPRSRNISAWSAPSTPSTTAWRSCPTSPKPGYGRLWGCRSVRMSLGTQYTSIQYSMDLDPPPTHTQTHKHSQRPRRGGESRRHPRLPGRPRQHCRHLRGQ